MEKFNTSKRTLALAAFGAFCILLVCNAMVHMFADDFVFAFDYSTFSNAHFTRISGLRSIFSSLKAVYFKENGRLVAHFFSQLFIFLPPIIFKVLNSAAFVLEIYLMYRLTKLDSQRSVLLFCVIFGCVWIFQPAFGEVNLWLDGACNYLWCSVFNLVFLFCFVWKYYYDWNIQKPLYQLLFILFSLLAGGYGENASLATIIVCIILLILSASYRHFRIRPYHILSLCFFFAGFLFMMLSPAEREHKFSALFFGLFLRKLVNALEIYYQFRMLLIALVVFFVLCVSLKVKPEILILSGVLFFGSLCSNFAMCFADYHPERSSFYSAILLILACAVLFQQLFETDYQILIVCVGAVTLLFTLYYGIVGMEDIYETHCFFIRGEQLIEEAQVNGVTDPAFPLPTGHTKYSQIYTFPYLLPNNDTMYPNRFIAEYYHFSSIIGYYE